MKPWVAWHVHLYSYSVHSSASTAGVIVAAAACILPGSSSKVVGNGGTQRVSSTFHEKKKLSGVSQRERSGQDTAILLSIHFCRSFRSKKASTHCNVKMRRLEVASCWNSITLRSLSKWHKEFLQHALVRTLYSRSAVGKKGTSQTCIFVYAQKHKLGTPLVRSISACWLLFFHILTLCGLVNPNEQWLRCWTQLWLTNLSQFSTSERNSQPNVLRTSSFDLTLQNSVFVMLKYQTSWQSDVYCWLRHVHSSGSFSCWFSWNVNEHKRQNSSQPKCFRMAWIFPLQIQPTSLHNL